MKRMFDKEEIVEIAKEEGGSITVDSELSPTSENPVQNKVIYEALNGKKLYLHQIKIANCYAELYSTRAEPFTDEADLAGYMYEKGMTTYIKGLNLVSDLMVGTGVFNNSLFRRFKCYAGNETNLSIRQVMATPTYDSSANKITFTQSIDDYSGIAPSEVTDNVIEI